MRRTHSRYILYGLFAALLGVCGAAQLQGCATGTPSVVIANAGEDFDVLTGEQATLDGLGSVGAGSIKWLILSKPAGSQATLTNTTSLTPHFVADLPGEYVVQLALNGQASVDTVAVTAKNVIAAITPDLASAITTRERLNASEFVITLEAAGGILSGVNSRTTAGNDVASYQWEQVAGPSATATGGTTNPTLTFTAPSLVNFFTPSDRYKWQPLPVSRNDTEMVFKLTVTSTDGSSDAATLIVYVQDTLGEIHTTSGLPNVGVDTVVRLSGPDLKANSSGPSTPITDWNWTLTPPAGSTVTFIDSGTNNSSLEFPYFIPDVEGLYTVAYSSTSAGVAGELFINAARWVGVGTIGGATPVAPQCANCHDGTIMPDKVTGWSQTVHAMKFADSMATYAGLAPLPFLWVYHTVGYNTDAVNNGFDDRVAVESFEFPESGLSFDTFVAEHPNLAELSNIQCENCHGPGSQHAGDPLRIAHSYAQYGTCGQCHLQEAQWINSAHNSTGVVHDRGAYQTAWLRASCARCHTAKGFATYVEEGHAGLMEVTETGAFPGVTCAGCHDLHDATNEHQLRVSGNVIMPIDGSTVDAGEAATCYTCHDGFYAYNELDCDSDHDGTADSICTTADQTATQYYRQIHYNPQAPVLEGKGGLTDLDGNGTDDFALTENSFHSSSNFNLAAVTGNNELSNENKKCITCHMAAGPSPEEEGYRHLGGHSMRLRVSHGLGHLTGEETEPDTVFAAGEFELVSACTTCHPSVTTFNRTARADYDGDGILEGIQDETRGLLLALSDKLKTLEPANLSAGSGTMDVAGDIEPNPLSYAGGRTGFNATTDLIRRGVWNHNLIVRDGTLGVHNAAFAIQLLQGTYTGLGGNSFADDFPDAVVR